MLKQPEVLLDCQHMR